MRRADILVSGSFDLEGAPGRGHALKNCCIRVWPWGGSGQARGFTGPLF